MQIANEFPLDLPLERAWPLLTDLERVAPAMPGVTVEGADGDDLRATMRVKVGPITVSYRTVVTLVSADASSHTAVLRARGRELRGRGTVEAEVTARLSASGSAATVVALTTELAVTGRVAQFGGGVMAEVADRLLRQFASRLVTELEAPAGATAAVGASGAAGAADRGPTVDEAYSGAADAGSADDTARGPTVDEVYAGTRAGEAGAGDDAAAAKGPSVDEVYSVAGAGTNGHAPSAASTHRAAPQEAEPVDLGSVAGAALLPSGPAVGAFLGAFLGTFLGVLSAALLLRSRKR